MTTLIKLERLFHESQKQLEAMPIIAQTIYPTKRQINMTKKYMLIGCASDQYILDRTGLTKYRATMIRKTF